MLALLTLHIATLLIWIASLLYVPVLVAGTASRRVALVTSPRRHDSVPRFLLTHIATPAAVVAIIAGTSVFLIDRNTEVWLIVKLTLVVALVLGHALTGLLVLRLEHPSGRSVQPWCTLLGLALLVLVALIFGVVLAKPAFDVLPTVG
jgi:protoporphyrinogen IX oxidase